VIGKISTLVFGTLIVLVAIEVNKLRTIGLFDLTNLLAATLSDCRWRYLDLGIILQANTGLVGVEYGARRLRRGVAGEVGVTPSVIERAMDGAHPFLHARWTDLLLVTSTIGTVIIGVGWFFFTSLFYRTSDRTADQEHTTVAPAAKAARFCRTRRRPGNRPSRAD